MLLPEYPTEDHKIQAQRSLEQVGGPVVRALSVAAKLGVTTMMSSVVGNDDPGKFCRIALESRNCGVDNVVVSGSGGTRRSHVWVSAKNGSRTIAYIGDSNIEPLATTPGLLDAVRSANMLHLDGRELEVALELASEARATQTRVVVDAGGWKPGLGNLIKLADYLVISESVLGERGSAHPLAAANTLLEDSRNLQAVLLTSGAEGTTIVHRSGTIHIPVVSVDVVDSNGAGDAFCGGFLAGLVLGRTLADAVRLGSGAAAAVCAHFGDYFPTLQEIEALDSAIVFELGE